MSGASKQELPEASSQSLGSLPHASPNASPRAVATSPAFAADQQPKIRRQRKKDEPLDEQLQDVIRYVTDLPPGITWENALDKLDLPPPGIPGVSWGDNLPLDWTREILEHRVEPDGPWKALHNHLLHGEHKLAALAFELLLHQKVNEARARKFVNLVATLARAGKAEWPIIKSSMQPTRGFLPGRNLMASDVNQDRVWECLRRDRLFTVGAEVLMRKDRPQRPRSNRNTPAQEASRVGRERRRTTTSGLRWRIENSDVEREAMRERELAQQKTIQYEEADDSLPMPTASALAQVRVYYEWLIAEARLDVGLGSSEYPNTGPSIAADLRYALYGVWFLHIQDSRRVEERNAKRRFGIRSREEMPRDEMNAGTAAGEYEQDSDGLDETDRASLALMLDEIRERQILQIAELMEYHDELYEDNDDVSNWRLKQARGDMERWMADLCEPVAVIKKSMNEDRDMSDSSALGSEDSRGMNLDDDPDADLPEWQRRREQHLKNAAKLLAEAEEDREESVKPKFSSSQTASLKIESQ